MGGTYLGKPTWEYDGTTWTSVTTPVDPGFSEDHGMAYDARRGSMVKTHGYSFPYPSTDTWEYTGTTWIRRTPSLSALPPQRQWAGFCFDTARGNFVLFGGTQFGSDLHLDDTWLYTPPTRGSATPFGTSCPGSAGAATLSSIGVPELGRTFQLKVASAPSFVTVAFCLGASDRQWAGTPLPLDLGPFGMTACRLYVSLDLMIYTSTGPAGWCAVPVAVPSDASLAGQQVYTQFGVWDPAANPGGLTTTNGLVLVIGA